MRLRVATWNINSVRLRHDQVARFVAETGVDVVCLQETKCREGEFPTQAFIDMGLPHLRIAGQKGWHGAAIASRLPIEDAPRLQVCREGHARCVSGLIAGVEVQNFYIPAGGDVPDRAVNPKFDHKLDFYERLTREMAARDRSAPLLLAGDFNIAPSPNDVWNHRHMSKIVSHTPIEVETLKRLQEAGGFVDLIREAVPEPQKLFSWWSYRAADFRASNRGLRLDHLWASPGLADQARTDGRVSAEVHDRVRAWERPSDHAPVTADLRVPDLAA
jgi:exodeoxyribonuclease III